MEIPSVFERGAQQATSKAAMETLAQMCAWFYASILEKTGSEALASVLTQQMLAHALRSATDATRAGEGGKGAHD